MARIYNTESPLLSAVKGYSEGQKQTQDEAYRQAMKDLAERKNVGDLSQFAYNQGKGQLTPELNDRGYATGKILDNQANIDRDQPVLEKAFPDMFKDVINKGQAARPDPAVQAEENASQKRMRLAAIEEANRMGTSTAPFLEPSSPGAPAIAPSQAAPQMDYAKPVTDALKPAPLLKAKDELLPGEAPDLSAARVPIGSKTPTGRPNEFVSSDVSRAEFGDRPVSGNQLPEKELPPVPEKVNTFNPSAMLRAGMIERLSSASAKDSDPIIPYSSLTPAQRATLRIPENAEGGQRASVLKEFIQLAGKSLDKDDKTISPMTLGAVKKIESGIPFSQAADELAKEQMFDLTDKQTSVLQAAESRRNSKVMGEKNLGFRQEEAETKKKTLSPKNEERILNLDTLRGNLENARNLVAAGKVRPRGELDVARRMGAFGGLPLEALNASLSAAGREPISDDEAQFLKLTANVNLSKLVEVAGTTFTERFGSMINSLGADITDPKRFNQNVDQMIGEIERAKSNIVNVGQANKSGKIREQQGMVSHAPKEEDRGPKPAKWNASMLRAEKQKAQKAIDAAKVNNKKNPDMEISWIKKTFKENTGVDFDGK